MAAGRLARKALDGIQYGLVLTALLIVGLTPLSLLVTGELVWVKWGLFLAGLVLMLVGSVKARPGPRRPPGAGGDWRPRLGSYLPADTYSTDGFGGLVGRLPPGGWYNTGPRDRLSDGGRFLVAWLVTWTVSYLLEAVFDVGVAPALR